MFKLFIKFNIKRNRSYLGVILTKIKEEDEINNDIYDDELIEASKRTNIAIFGGGERKSTRPE